MKFTHISALMFKICHCRIILALLRLQKERSLYEIEFINILKSDMV